MEEFIDYERLERDKDELRSQWLSKKPFHYLCFDNILKSEAAETVYNAYPTVKQEGWSNTTYLNQQNKFTMTSFSDPILQQIFSELNGQKLLDIVSYITGIEGIVGDDQFFGGGLHQSTNGAYLDVHVDFNYHPETKFHRRMNILIYMNKDWKEEYNGYLELWDMDKKEMIDYVEPKFNRCVIFETNEISFHGHPRPLNTPEGISRKSIAAYYYTADRPSGEVAADHNTIYVNVEGVNGKVKNFKSGVKAFLERINKK